MFGLEAGFDLCEGGYDGLLKGAQKTEQDEAVGVDRVDEDVAQHHDAIPVQLKIGQISVVSYDVDRRHHQLKQHFWHHEHDPGSAQQHKGHRQSLVRASPRVLLQLPDHQV